MSHSNVALALRSKSIEYQVPSSKPPYYRAPSAKYFFELFRTVPITSMNDTSFVALEDPTQSEIGYERVGTAEDFLGTVPHVQI